MVATDQELLEARELVERFWAALGDGDEAALEGLYYGPSRLRIQAPVGAFARALREILNVTVDDCRGMAVTTRARILASIEVEDAAAFLCARGDGRIRVLGLDGPELVNFWRPVVYRKSGEPWRLWGTADDEALDAATEVDLAVPLPDVALS